MIQDSKRPIQLRLDEMLTKTCEESCNQLELIAVEAAKLRQITEQEQQDLLRAMDILGKLADRGIWYADPNPETNQA